MSVEDSRSASPLGSGSRIAVRGAGQRRPARTTSWPARNCAAAPSPTCRPSRRRTRRPARWSASTSTSATRIAKRWGVKAKITPLSVEARVPEVKLGRVDLTIANLAYTLGRAEQIQFSDPYYLAKEMLAVKASDPGTIKADFKGKRLASTKGSTSELSIKMNGSEPLTFQDTGSAFMAVQQNKALGMVANTMTITKLVNQSKTKGVELKMIEEPMVFQPIGIGMKKDEPALLAKVNETLQAMDAAGEINQLGTSGSARTPNSR